MPQVIHRYFRTYDEVLAMLLQGVAANPSRVHVTEHPQGGGITIDVEMGADDEEDPNGWKSAEVDADEDAEEEEPGTDTEAGITIEAEANPNPETEQKSPPESSEPEGGGSSVEEPETQQPAKGGALAQQAGILCAQKAFWVFMEVKDAEHAADELRSACGVNSRAELDHDKAAARLFKDLKIEYENWMKE